MVRTLLMVLCFLGLTSQIALAEVSIPQGRVAIIDGVIRGNNLDSVATALMGWSRDKTGNPVHLVLNSPGGSVSTGFRFVNQMQDIRTRVQIYCYVSDYAASMAFQILIHCDKRYSLERSTLLWHRVRTYSEQPLTVPLMRSLVNALADIDKVIISEVMRSAIGKTLGRTRTMYHLEQESWHIGSDLASRVPMFLTALDTIPGLYEALDNKDLPRTQGLSLADLFGQVWRETGEVYYISDRLRKQFLQEKQDGI